MIIGVMGIPEVPPDPPGLHPLQVITDGEVLMKQIALLMRALLSGDCSASK
jgi:hypothetical protein